MKLFHNTLYTDVSGSFSRAFPVIKVETDEGIYVFSEHTGKIGEHTLIPAILNIGDIREDRVQFTVEVTQLPQAVTYWINRPVSIILISPANADIEEGGRLFDGVIEAQPQLRGMNAYFSATTLRINPKLMPDVSPITREEFPSAAATALNKIPPAVFGDVENLVLLPIEKPPYSRLARDAKKGDMSLSIISAAEFPVSGDIIVDGVSYSYSSRNEETLFGVTVERTHYAGTQVAVEGEAKFLCAHHPVNSITSVMARDEQDETRLTPLYPSSVNVSDATVSFVQAPVLERETGDANIQIEFDTLDGASTALNGINAIRASTGTDTQTALYLPEEVDDENPQDIEFDIPDEQGGTNRIISAIYTVSFTVSVTGGIPLLGRTIVKIGGVVAWVWDGGEIVYNGSPLTIISDQDSHFVPVRVLHEGSQNGAFQVDITAASRDIVLGNIDSANYATLRKPDHDELIVTQTTDNPNLGRIDNCRLVVEYFARKSNLDRVDVYWNDAKIGFLSASNEPESVSEHTIDIDTVSSGTAELISTSISNALISAFNRTDNAVSIPYNIPISYTPKETSGSPPELIVYSLDIDLALPENVQAGNYVFTVYSNTAAGGTNNTTQAELGGVAFTPNGSSQTVTVSLTAGQTTLNLKHDVDLDPPLGEINTSSFPTLKLVSATLQSKPSQNSLSLSGAATTGSIAVSDGTSTVTGVTSTANIDGTGLGELTVSIPAAPRTVINTFTLSHVVDWSELTNTSLRLHYVGEDDDDIHVVRAYIVVDYKRLIHEPVTTVVAHVSGLSGNPADILKTLIEMNGQAVDDDSHQALQQWCAVRDYTFSRCFESRREVSDLIELCAEQIGVMPVERAGKTHLIRKLDENYPVTVIQEKDLLSFPVIDWSSTDDICNDLVVYYHPDRGDYLRSNSRSPQRPDNIAARSQQNLNFLRSVEYEAGWITDDHVAECFSRDYIKLNAPIRRFLRLELPYTFAALEAGDLVYYEPQNLKARITFLSQRNGWISLVAEEVYSVEGDLDIASEENDVLITESGDVLST